MHLDPEHPNDAQGLTRPWKNGGFPGIVCGSWQHGAGALASGDGGG